MVNALATSLKNEDMNQIKSLTAVLLLLLSVLLYMIGIYLSRTGYPEFIEKYPDINFISIIHPLIFPSVIMLGIAIYLFAVTRHELFLLLSLIIMGIYLWNTNAIIASNAQVYDTYWHYSVSNYILENNKFTTGDITDTTFYLNYPFTGILGAEFNLITGLPRDRVMYYFPLVNTLILILLLYTSTGLFFENSLKIQAIAVLGFIIGNASLHTHFAPQTIAMLMFAFLFYLAFKFVKGPDEKIRIMIILILFIIIITHPLTSFLLGLVFISIIVINFFYKQPLISNTMLLLFFIFFFAWQIYWALLTSTTFFQQLSDTFSLILSQGLFKTGGMEYIARAQSFNPVFYQFRFTVHLLFISLSLLGFIVIARAHTKKYILMLSFITAPVLFFIFTYFTYSLFMYERAIMFIYLPISISLGYFIYKQDLDRKSDHSLLSNLRFMQKIKTQMIMAPIKNYNKHIISILFIVMIILSGFSVYTFGLQGQPAVVPTQDIYAGRFIEKYENDTILCYKTNAIIFFYNVSSNIYLNPELGWQYWAEQHKPPDEREAVYKPDAQSIIFSKKLNDLNLNFDHIKMNLNNDTTLNRIYDNGFTIIYS